VSEERSWEAVEAWFDSRIMPADAVLEAALAAAADAGLPAIAVSPSQGRLLSLLARSIGARRILEVGTLAGYSAIWMARALPAGGQLVTCEIDPRHAEVAAGNIATAGLGEKVDIRLGPAAKTLEALAEPPVEPFDLVFIDADKPANPRYLALALRLTHSGSLIVIDNVVRGGQVLDAVPNDSARGVQQVTELIAGEPRLEATAIQTVGSKGWDGFILARVN